MQGDHNRGPAGTAREFSRAELARYGGSRGPTYVAVDGVVYDVTGSGEWRGGLHRELHWAGQDLTAYLAEAPHGMETLLRYPVVGTLTGDVPATSADPPKPNARPGIT